MGHLPSEVPSEYPPEAIRRAKTALDNIAKIHGFNLTGVQLNEGVRAVSRALALATRPADTSEREVVARIIDRRAFDGWQGQYDNSIKGNDADFAKRCADYWYGNSIQEAYRKADAILAAFPVASSRSASAAEAVPDSYRDTVRQVGAAREKRLAELKSIVDWVDSWVSNPVGSYSVHALDGLFSRTRDKIRALSPPSADRA